MESKKPTNPFQEVHKQVQERVDRAREVRQKDGELRRKKADEEAVREGFDRSTVPDSKRPRPPG